VVAAVEEFGIAAVEAQAAGRPVIAVRGGGTLETVVDGETGCFWSGGADELAAVVAGFDDAAIDPQACVRNAARFDTSIFKRDLPRHVESALNVDDAPAPRRTRPVLRTARLARRAGL
jgi:glycosyltransferase involved in cell wall biosynthesis